MVGLNVRIHLIRDRRLRTDLGVVSSVHERLPPAPLTAVGNNTHLEVSGELVITANFRALDAEHALKATSVHAINITASCRGSDRSCECSRHQTIIAAVR
jgi:hypothetical protein